MSMIVVPSETQGIEIIRNVAVLGERDDLDEGIHGYVRYNQVRVPLDAMLGGPGEGFKVAQSRLGGGRVHHAMRTVGVCRRAFDMMSERALSRSTQGETLARKQSVQQVRSEEHTSELQSLMRISYAVFCLKKKKDMNVK